MKNLLSINEIKQRVNEISRKIGVFSEFNTYVTYNFTRGDGTPNIEADNDGYYYIISERGVEYERKRTQDIQELLYWILKDITFHVVLDHSLYSSGWEHRRIIWKNQLELLGRISNEFKEKYKKEIMDTLKDVPLEDGLPNNMDYETWEYLGKTKSNPAQKKAIYPFITQINTEDF
jgi:hypothetical protein